MSFFGPTPCTVRARFGFAGSAAGHAAIAAILLALPVVRPIALPEVRHAGVHILTWDVPPPPPLPPTRGSSLAPPARQSAPAPSAPDAFTAPVDAPPLASEPRPEAQDVQAEPSGSETGSEEGDPAGLEGGRPDGAVGGLPGGVPGGQIGGTGSGPAIERTYDRPPWPIHITQPIYPQQAFVEKVQGTVLVEFVVDVDGRVVRARVVRSVPRLDAAALETVRQWSFAPAVKGGRPVATVAQAPITFRIH